MTDTPCIKTLIIDDHPMVAEGIQSILESYDDIDVVGTCNSARSAIDQLDRLNPDVILMDLNMPDLGGHTPTEIILGQRPGTRITGLSMHHSPEHISPPIIHGNLGYVPKDVPTGETQQASEGVVQGERHLCTGARGSAEPHTDNAREALTGREQTILLQLAQGKSNKQVALALDISVRTVETHRKNIKRKLGISSTAGLTRYALEHGVLQGTGARF